MLLSHEDPQAILDLQTAWEKEFPGNSQCHVTQREILLRSDWHRRRLAVAFEELQLDLAFTGLPMQYWGPQILKRFDGLHRTSSRAERNFMQSLRAMQAATSAEKDSAGKLTKDNPPEPVIETIGTYTYQSVCSQSGQR